jgi:hypothetical protein
MESDSVKDLAKVLSGQRAWARIVGGRAIADGSMEGDKLRTLQFEVSELLVLSSS